MIHIIPQQSFSKKKFLQFSSEQQWKVLAEFDADPAHGEAGQVICEDPATKAKCYYVEDYLIDLRYLIIEGKKEKELELAANINKAKNIPLVKADEIFGMIVNPKDKKELVLGLRMLAVISPTSYEQKFYKLFSNGLQHEDPMVRHAAIQIVTYPAWSEFRDIVHTMAEEDPNPMVKERAKGFVKAYDELFKKKTKVEKNSKSAAKKKSKVKAKVKAKVKVKAKAKSKAKAKVKPKAKKKSVVKSSSKQNSKISTKKKVAKKSRSKAR